MFIDIDKIKVSSRIRKDFGDINELAEDIKKNGLINPPAINKEYQLLAGERRLRACKLLGWKQIPVNMIDTDGEEQDLSIEISENEARKEFTMTERLAYARKLTEIESAKAKQRSLSNLNHLNVECPNLGSLENNSKTAPG
jgi:ParB family chromosome partitioning protein